MNCTYINGDEQQACELPLRITTDENADITVKFFLRTTIVSPSHFLIIPDDCLQQFIVNGSPVDDPSIPLCDYTKGHTFDLGTQLHTGNNTIEAVIHNNGGSAVFLLQPSWSDRMIAIPVAVGSLALLCFIVLRVSRKKKNSWSAPMIILFILAALLRIYYVAVTPHWVRGQDTDGHIDYINYLLDNRALPPPDAGWEFWQPPLYYVISAVWVAPLRLVGLSESSQLIWVQILSLTLSLWTVLLAMQIGKRIFLTDRERTTGLPLFVGLIAFVPSLVMLSARINNDALEVPLAFLTVLLLLEWWNKGKRSVWLWAIVALSLAILSKSNALLLLPVAYICLFVKNGWRWKRTMIDGCAGLLIITLLAGWFTIYRHVSDTNQDPLVGNTATLNSGLVVDNSFAAYVTFNPVEFVRMPYNNPWEDAARRQYFWEYLYRSAFFGEFNFDEGRKALASWLLVFSFSAFLLSMWGWIMGWKHWKDFLPLLLLGVVFPAGHAAFRFRYPSGSSQDFRYIVPFLIPAAAFVTLWWVRLPVGILRNSLLICLQTFIVLCAIFLLHA